MSSIVDESTLRARAPPPEDRARLTEDLLASLQEGTDPEIEAAWDVEIRRRLDEVDSGNAKLIPAAEVFSEVRRMLMAGAAWSGTARLTREAPGRQYRPRHGLFPHPRFPKRSAELAASQAGYSSPRME